MSIFKGAGTALITPFKNDKVDFDALDKLLDMQLEGGIDAIIVNGTTGEPTTMSHAERTAVAKFAINKVNKRVPVIVGTGSNNTHTAIGYSVEAEELGADGLLLVTPYYNKATQNGLIAHYKAISDNVNIPIILYNVPSRTGLNMQPETVKKLAGYKNISAIKEASGSVQQMMEIVRLCNNKIDLMSGEDGLIYPCFAVGGTGIISVASNIIPKYVSDMAKQFFAGNIKKALQMQLDMSELVAALFCEVNPIPVKTAASLMGLCDSYMRMPMTKMENVDQLKKAMKNFGIQIKE
ncbi:MAG: 4-hydroxy-tetrahydrodipicolinate synthase [Bacillota bacterium]